MINLLGSVRQWGLEVEMAMNILNGSTTNLVGERDTLGLAAQERLCLFWEMQPHFGDDRNRTTAGRTDYV